MQFKTTISHSLNMNKGEDALKIVRVTQNPVDDAYGFYYDAHQKACVCTAFTMSDGSVDSLFIMPNTTAIYEGGLVRSVSILGGMFRIDSYGQPVIDEIYAESRGTLMIRYKKTLALLFNVCKFHLSPGSCLVVDGSLYHVTDGMNVDRLIDDIIHPKVSIIQNPFTSIVKKKEDK